MLQTAYAEIVCITVDINFADIRNDIIKKQEFKFRLRVRVL